MPTANVDAAVPDGRRPDDGVTTNARSDNTRRRTEPCSRIPDPGPGVAVMGVNFVPHVGNFQLSNESFESDDHDVHDGCVTPGDHRLLRFDMLTYNAGDTDAEIGRPENNEDLFEHSDSHGHEHLKGFNRYDLYDADGNDVGVGRKQAFCLMDSAPIPDHPESSSGGRFDCTYQGISAGWYDKYGAHLGCQYVVVDGLPDGKYTLEATTNAEDDLQESCRGDNTTWAGVEIKNGNANRVSLPWAPEDDIAVDPNNVQAKRITQGGRSTWKVVDDGHWIMDFGGDESAAKRAASVIRHYGLSYVCFVGRPSCPDHDPLMYWLTDDHDAPTGSMRNEDTVTFDPSNLTVTRVGRNWKVVDGSHWLLDFGPSEGIARAARYFLQKYEFTEMGFVNRPNPEMTYFKSDIDLEGIVSRGDFFQPREFPGIGGGFTGTTGPFG